jgi:alkylation response protein AidB-like acyl-CoA dehydrogenase
MSGAFTAEHEEIRRYVRQWLDERASIDVVRDLMETEAGSDPGHWAELAELGWLGMAVDEELGGAGQGFMEMAVVAEEMGRSLFPSPFLSTVVMGSTLVAAIGTGEQKQALLPEIATGRRRLAVAIDPAARPSVSATESAGSWILEGVARFVLDGHTADLVLVEAGTALGPRVFVVESGAQGFRAERLSVLDPTRPQADLTFSGVPARLLGDPEVSPEPAREEMLIRAIGALVMEQVGGAQACLDMSVEYAKNRHQFGRPIGSFQAIKHMCADMLVEVESARSAAYHLAWAIDHDPDEARIAAPIAKAYCADTYYRTAASTIQIHGGIGFTWEHDAHLHLKRAKSGQLFLGDSVAHRAVLADRLGIG